MLEFVLVWHRNGLAYLLWSSWMPKTLVLLSLLQGSTTTPVWTWPSPSAPPAMALPWPTTPRWSACWRQTTHRPERRRCVVPAAGTSSQVRRAVHSRAVTVQFILQPVKTAMSRYRPPSQGRNLTWRPSVWSTPPARSQTHWGRWTTRRPKTSANPALAFTSSSPVTTGAAYFQRTDNISFQNSRSFVLKLWWKQTFDVFLTFLVFQMHKCVSFFCVNNKLAKLLSDLSVQAQSNLLWLSYSSGSVEVGGF